MLTKRTGRVILLMFYYSNFQISFALTYIFSAATAKRLVHDMSSFGAVKLIFVGVAEAVS